MQPSRNANRGRGRASSARRTAPTAQAGRTDYGRNGNGAGLRRSRPTEMNIFMILFSLVLGVATWIVERILFIALEDRLPMVFLIGLMFAVLTLVLTLGIFIISNMQGSFDCNLITGGTGAGGAVLAIVAGSIAVFLIASLFQFLYSLNFSNKVTEPTSYIFIIDESGSMEGNDPTGLRYDAIEEVLSGKSDTFPYMVYGFNSDYRIIRDMAPISDGPITESGNATGGTAIKYTLTEVFNDYENQVWDGGETPKIILLTDGQPTDFMFAFQINGILKQYAKESISISTVRLGSSNDEVMRKIAESTGGVYIDTPDAANLAEAMKSAALNMASRNLLSSRFTVKMNVLYAIMRILFLAILAAIIKVLAAVAYGHNESAGMIISTSLVLGTIGSLIMEFGTAIGGSDRICWLLLWIFISITICAKYGAQRYQSARSVG